MTLIPNSTAATAKPDTAKLDQAAQEKASEANLESIAPREGVTIGALLGAVELGYRRGLRMPAEGVASHATAASLRRQIGRRIRSMANSPPGQ